MRLFGFYIVRAAEYERLHFQSMRLHEAYRWFSGWKDLEVIWEVLLHGSTGTSEARTKYAKARGTDSYGKTIKTEGV